MNNTSLETIALLLFFTVLFVYFGICTVDVIENITNFIALGALPMTTNLSSLIPSSADRPDFNKFPFEHDFVLDGRPQSFARNLDGSAIIAVGAEVITQYGVGYVERRHVDGSYIVRITEFDESVEVPQYADPTVVNKFGVVSHYISAREMVSALSGLYNNRCMQRAMFFENRMKDRASADENLDLVIDADCYEVSIRGGDYCGATEFIFAPATNPLRSKKSSAETAAYRARVQAMADALLNDTEDDEVVPDGIADELAECFGE